MIRTTVVLVNYNGGDAIAECVRALVRQVSARDIMIVDNASSDGSSRRIHREFPDVSILPLRRNVGFARAVNIAASRIDHDGALVTLNQDTLPLEGFVESLARPLAEHRHIGSVAGTLVFSSDPSVIASAGIRVHRNGVALDDRVGKRVNQSENAIRPVFGASGGAAAYRLSAFRETGGMCEPFFLYLEDVDLAWRLRLRGWESVHASAAIATHDYSSASGEGSPFKRRLLARNRIWTLARCLPGEFWTRDRAAIITFDLLAAGHGTVTLDGASLRGRMAGISALPMRLREREAIQATRRIGTDELSRWIQPPISPVELLRLRRVTGMLAQRTGR